MSGLMVEAAFHPIVANDRAGEARERHRHGDRPPARPGQADGAGGSGAAGRRRRGGGRRLAHDAGEAHRVDRRAEAQSAAGRSRTRRGGRLPQMARRQSLHAARRATTATTRRRASTARSRDRARRAARSGRPHHPQARRRRRIDAGGRGLLTDPQPVVITKSNSPQPRPPRRRAGLYRRQALRFLRPADRRAALRRPLHLVGLSPAPVRNPAAAAQGGARRPARRVRSLQP